MATHLPEEGSGIRIVAPMKSILAARAWLPTVYQVFHLHYNSPSLFPEQKRMQWVELLIHLSIWQVAPLIWQGDEGRGSNALQGKASSVLLPFVTPSP